MGSADDSKHDQVLDCVLLPASTTGKFKFILEVPAPNHSEIPDADVAGVTIVLLTCSYKEKEFVRVGYYVSNEYPTEEENENPPATPKIDELQRKIAAHEPRVTKFPHDFDFVKPPTAVQDNNNVDSDPNNGTPADDGGSPAEHEHELENSDVPEANVGVA